MIELNGMELTIEQVIAVARHNEQVRISEPAKEKINRARAYVDEKLAQKAVDLRSDDRLRQIFRHVCPRAGRQLRFSAI